MRRIASFSRYAGNPYCLRFSTVSKSPQSPHYRKTRRRASYYKGHPRNEETVHPLLKELSSILGTVDASSEGKPQSEACTTREEIEGCRNHVRQNFELEYKKKLIDKVTEIVKTGDEDSPMGEKLVGCPMEHDVVEMVIQNLIDVPYFAFRFFDWAKLNGLCVNTSKILKNLICIAGEAREPCLLDRALMELENDKCSREVDNWSSLVLQFGKAGLPLKALSSFEKMRMCGCEPDAEAYRVIMRVLCYAGKPEIAYQLYKEMIQNNMIPDLSSSRLLLRVLADAGIVQSVLFVSNKMIELHHLSESQVYGSVLESFYAASRVKELLEFLHGSKLMTCREVLHTMTGRLCASGNAAEAMEIVRKAGAINGNVYEGIISNFLRKKDVVNALDLFESMKNCGYQPTKSTYKALIHHLFDSKRHEDGCRVQEEMKNSGLDDDDAINEEKKMHLSESDNHFSEQDLREVNKLLSSGNWFSTEQSLNKSSIHFTSILVLEAMRESRRHGKIALHFFSWVAIRHPSCLNSATYNMAIKIAGAGKDFVSMRKLFHEMRRKGCLVSSDTWAIMIMQYGRAGLTEIALKLFKEMKEKGYQPSYSVYKCLITSLCERNGRSVNRAIKLFRKMILCGHLPEKKLVESFLICVCEAGKAPAARISVHSLCKAGFNHVSCQTLYVRALCRAGNLDEALKFVDEFGEDKTALQKNTFASVIHAHLRKGKLEEAMEKIDSMKKVGIFPTTHVYSSLIVHFFREKQAKRALETLCKMQKEGCQPTVVTYYSLINGYMQMGKVTDAWRVFRSLKEMEITPNFKVYSMFVQCLCKNGESEAAWQLVLEMRRAGIVPSCVNFRTVLFGLNREGKHRLGRAVIREKVALRKERKFIG